MNGRIVHAAQFRRSGRRGKFGDLARRPDTSTNHTASSGVRVHCTASLPVDQMLILTEANNDNPT